MSREDFLTKRLAERGEELERLRAAVPSRVEREEIEDMRSDYESGRKIFASSAAVALRVIDRFMSAINANHQEPKP